MPKTLLAPIAINQQMLFDSMESRKNDFLMSIKKPEGYKQYIISPIAYPGGKSKAVGYIMELLPTNIGRLVSPFFGGGSFEFACNKILGLEIKGFDIFDILVNYWKCQLGDSELLYRRIKSMNLELDNHPKYRKILQEHFNGIKIINDPFRLASLYAYNLSFSFNAKFLHPTPVFRNFKTTAIKNKLNKIRNFKSKNVSVECKSFEQVFKKYPNDFFYCDPPYYKYERYYENLKSGFNHELLRDCLLNHKGEFILSYNYCDTVKEWYKDFPFTTFEIKYCSATGKKEKKISREVLIYKIK